MAGLNKAQRWERDRTRVVNFIVNNPGSTGRAIAYHTGVSVSRVHQIIGQDREAFEYALQGYVSVQKQYMKPSWYDPSMTKVPLVSGSGIAVDQPNEVQAINDTFKDDQVRRQVLDIYYNAKRAVVMPSSSMRNRRRAATEIMSGVHILGNGLQEKKREVSEVNQRLERIEQMLLTGPRRGRPRKAQVEA